MTLDSRRPPRLLVVENDADTRAMLRVWFENCCGCAVVEAATAVEALTHLSEQVSVADAVVTDIALPGIDGIELCRRLRRDPATRSMPIIGATGFAMPHQVALARQAGFDCVLTKPYALSELLQEVASLLPSWISPPVIAGGKPGVSG